MTTECLSNFDVHGFEAAPRARRVPVRELVPAIVAGIAYVLLLPAASLAMSFLGA